MTDYISTDYHFEYSARTEKLYRAMLERLKPNRVREDTLTGPEPDGKTPFIDVFCETDGEYYAVRLAKAIVRSWMETEAVIYDGELIIGHPRPVRPLQEHFSFGITQSCYILDDRAYADRKDEILSQLRRLDKSLYPLNMNYVGDEARRRFDKPGESAVYDELVDHKLWWVGGFQGHTVPNYRTLLTMGIGGVLSEVKSRLRDESDEHKRITLSACAIILDGMTEWIYMMADAAERRAAEAENGEDRGRFIKCAENCRSIASAPPRDFYGACQLVWFYSLWDWVDCLGRADQYLYPFFRDAKVSDRAFAEDLCACLMMKFLEHGAHNITVGGIIPETGGDAVNELSFLLLQILRRTHETHPRMSVRVNEKSDGRLLALAVKMWSEGMSDPTLVSDSAVIPAFIKNYSVLPEDAADYTVLGCQELEIPGKSNFGCEDGLLNLAKILEFTLNDGYSRFDGRARIGLATGHITDYNSFDELLLAYDSQVSFFTRHFCELCNMGQEIRAANYAKLVKTPFTDDCVAKALSLDEGGAIYNLGCVETAGVAVVADSLTAIKKLVFDNKLISKETLEAALAADFDGYEDVRLLLLNRASKFGNDDSEADAMACRVLDYFWRELKKYRSVRGGEFTGACSLLSGGVGYGRETWATPDGRHTGEALGNSIGPRPGADKNSLTAMLNSCAKLPLEYGLGGTTCNIVIPTSIVRTTGKPVACTAPKRGNYRQSP